MGKSSNVINLAASIQPQSFPPFYIIRDYRRIMKQRKQRDLRKKQLLMQKELVLEASREEKMERVKQMNRSMLQGDDVWNMINQDIKMEESGQSFTHDIESGINKRIQQIRLEVLFTLGHERKEKLYHDSFSPFQFISC